MNAKLDTGRVFERIFSFYGSQFTLLIPAALVLFIPIALINGLLLSTGGVLVALLSAALSLIATFWYQGMVVEATRDILDGRRDHTIGSLFSSASPFIAPLIGVGILAGIAIGIGLVLLIIPGLYLLTIWAVIVPVIVIERVGVFDSFGRSRELVRGSGWQVFGVIVVIFLVSFIVRAIIGAIIGGISDDSFAGYAAVDLIVNVLLVPLSALAATVMYFELRRVKGDALPEEGGAPSPLPPQEGPPPATHVSERPPEPSDAPPQQGGPEAPPAGPQAPPR
jgi:hypothetical protein